MIFDSCLTQTSSAFRSDRRVVYSKRTDECCSDMTVPLVSESGAMIVLALVLVLVTGRDVTVLLFWIQNLGYSAYG